MAAPSDPAAEQLRFLVTVEMAVAVSDGIMEEQEEGGRLMTASDARLPGLVSHGTIGRIAGAVELREVGTEQEMANGRASDEEFAMVPLLLKVA